MTDFLQRMAAASYSRCKSARELRPAQVLRRGLDELATPRRLTFSGWDLLCEIKLGSPSEGVIVGASGGDERERILEQVMHYLRAGAAAISVLTEPFEFRGDLLHLAAVSGLSTVPVMRKDFLIDPYQVLEARVSGADGVLLITRMLDDRTLRAMLDEARELGLFVLLEAFDARDLERAGELLTDEDDPDAVLLGLNARDLSTLELDPERLAALVGQFPAGFRKVAESGLQTPDDAERLAGLGYDLALVGTALMRSERPDRLAAEMLYAGREARGG